MEAEGQLHGVYAITRLMTDESGSQSDCNSSFYCESVQYPIPTYITQNIGSALQSLVLIAPRNI